MKKGCDTLKRKKLKTVFIILLCIMIYISVLSLSIINYGNKDEKCNADVAIVLGAATYNGTLSPVYEERANHGIYLYKNGLVKKIIFTGGYGKSNELSDSCAAKLYAVSQDIPEEDILIEEKSTITQENIKYSKEIMAKENLRTAIIVSDPLHMKRSMLMARDYEIEAFSSPTPTTRYITLKSKIPFLLREMFFYTGYIAYRIIF